jgi:hypothetical protein
VWKHLGGEALAMLGEDAVAALRYIPFNSAQSRSKIYILVYIYDHILK